MSTSTPSKPITDGQIGKTQELLGAVLRKHASELPSNTVHDVLTSEGSFLQADFLAIMRQRVEQRAKTIVRKVVVKRGRTPQQVLDATKRTQYTDQSVVATMPTNGTGLKNVIVEFFRLSRWVSDADLAREYEERGLTPDPYAQAAVNEADPAFADKHPNGTHWQDAKGNWCLVTFNRFDDGRRVSVNRNSDDWGGGWWFAGVRK